MRPWVKKRNHGIVRDLNKGLSVKEVAEKNCVSEWTVRYVARLAKKKPPYR